MMTVDDEIRNSSRGGVNEALRFILGLPAIFLYFLMMTLVLKTVFIAVNWSYLRPDGFGSIVRALLLGLRFDVSILLYLFIPAILIYYSMVVINNRLLKWIFQGYFIAMALFIQILWLADIQYFEEAGKHFTYEAFAYLGVSLVPVLSGAFKLHPWLSSLSLLSAIVFAFLTGWVIQWCLKLCIPEVHIRIPYYILSFIVLLFVEIVGARGGIQQWPLDTGNSLISTSPYLNAVCLNPVYSAFKAVFSSSSKQFQFFDEEFNVRAVRDLLDIGQIPPSWPRYPLVRNSPGTEKGNRKNVVIFVLESWTGDDIGCLGSKLGLTPFFDNLSRQGMLFTNFFATGIRTSEGIFSIFCSFPNQPLKPIMQRADVYQTRWRSLSEILEEAGYYNIFIHGRDLDFDSMHQFLTFIHFHKIIDRRDFPPSVSSFSDSWPGYNDEEVMRRADEEFSKQSGHPFFGVIYTMNTHPPFVIPEEFPKSFPSTTISNKFFNSLRYSDHALETFFNIVKNRPYFKNTIFIFVADHCRTRDNFNFYNQHHIPMLIYSPGYIQHSINPVVGSQLDLLPTVLGLLKLKTSHSSWGRNLLDVPHDKGFAVCVVGNDVRWHDSNFLLDDSMTEAPLFLCDIIRDHSCTTNVWQQNQKTGEILKTKVRSYISLSRTLLYGNRVYPCQPDISKIKVAE
jgi:phosphoglycerol transferase MdoB-like AlkP superfamily enzyme